MIQFLHHRHPAESVAESLVAESEAVVSVAPVPDAAIKPPIVADPL